MRSAAMFQRHADAMTREVLEQFFHDPSLYLGQAQPKAASLFFPFCKLACPEGSHFLPGGSLPPFSPNGACGKPDAGS